MSKIKLLFFMIPILTFSVKLSMSQNIASGLEGQSTYYEIAKNIQSVYPELSVHNTGGSYENITKLLNESSDINLAFVQYDALLNYQIRNSEIKQKTEIVLPMYNEEVHLITKRGNDIQSINDIQDKIIAIGSISQGTNITAKNIISFLNIDCEVIDIAYRDAFAALLDDKIDAFFYVGGVPVKNLSDFSIEISNLIKLVPIESDKLNGIYKNTSIKKEVYPWLVEDINTISVQSFVVYNKTKETANFDVDNFINAVTKNLQEFQSGDEYHQKWNDVNLESIQYPDWPVNETTLKTFKQ